MHLFFVRQLLGAIQRRNSAHACRLFPQQGWCNCHDSFLLRCGVSEGPLILYRDLNGNFNLAGDTVNMAARVMDLADAGQVFLTRETYHRLYEMVPGTEGRFREYAQARIKHDIRVDVFQYVDEGVDGLDVAPRGDLGLADPDQEPDEEAIPIVTPTEGPENLRIEVSGEGGSGKGAPAEGDGNDPLSRLGRRLIRVPEGEFVMGNEQIGSVKARIPRALLVDPYPTTQDLYLAVMGRNPSRFADDQRPVDSVSWLDATTFCNRLSELAELEPVYEVHGKEVLVHYSRNGYRLPTEAEWEYCCRQAQTCGPDRYGPLSNIAWYNSNANGSTQKVGHLQPNSLGLHDMLGNVWEWCNDWYQRRYPQKGQVPLGGPESGLERVLRGGSWNDIPDCARASFRHRTNPLSRESSHGLRLVRSIAKN